MLPPALGAHDPSGREILEDIARLIGSRPNIGEITIDPRITSSLRSGPMSAPKGLRLTFVWSVDGLPPGALQQDFVYREPLLQEPEEISVALGDGSTVDLLAATPALSLCWTLLWLGTDRHPQGKDLYDAVLLAERTALPPGRLERVVAQAVTGTREQPCRCRRKSTSGRWIGTTSGSTTPMSRVSSRKGSSASQRRSHAN